ncbi:MAG: hypothetical protein AAF682_23550 [Planctomycetota bacterium]
MIRKFLGRRSAALRTLELAALAAVLTGALPASSPSSGEAFVLADIGWTRHDANVLIVRHRGAEYTLAYKKWPAPTKAGVVTYEGSILARPFMPPTTEEVAAGSSSSSTSAASGAATARAEGGEKGRTHDGRK